MFEILETLYHSLVLERGTVNLSQKNSVMLLDEFTNYFSFFQRFLNYFQIHFFLFCIFSFVVCIFALSLVLIANPIYSVISLIVVYLFSAFILICFEIHFLSVVFILIYLGAVIVLFLFIVMMLNIKVQNTFTVSNIINLLFLFLFVFFFFKDILSFKSESFFQVFDVGYLHRGEKIEKVFFDFLFFVPILDIYLDNNYLVAFLFHRENYMLFGFMLYTYFYLELLVSSYILLLAMVGCISLTLVKKSGNLRQQESMEQLLHVNTFLKRKL